MADRRELIEAALDNYPEGIALTNAEEQVVFWNRTAESISGFPSQEMVGRPLPWAVERSMDAGRGCDAQDGRIRAERGVLLHVQHKQGSDLNALVRTQVLRDGLGVRIGSFVAFRDAAQSNTLPHGKIAADSDAGATQARVEERVEELFNEFTRRAVPFGVLWITVDQARSCARRMARAPARPCWRRWSARWRNGLRPGEEMGRWGDDEFLVISHERTGRDAGGSCAGAGRSGPHGRLPLVGRPRIAHREHRRGAGRSGDETLAQLLERRTGAMQSSIHAGGNHSHARARGGMHVRHHRHLCWSLGPSSAAS